MCLFAKLRLLTMMAAMLLAATPAQSACPVPLLQPDDPPQDDKICEDRAGLENFAHLAWRTLTMLVWPAESRGKADKTRSIIDMSGLRVFETYKSDWEIFPTIAAGLSDWNTYPSEARFCKLTGLPDGSLVLGALDKFESVTLPGGAPHALMAQNGSLVRYLAAFNEKAFDRIKTLDSSVNFEASESEPTDATRAQNGTITIKSAWIEIRNSTPDPSRFYVRSAWVQDPSTGQCRQSSVALVGLHVVHKTEFSQQWVWASFEHVENAPLRGAPPAGRFTFNDGSGVAMPSAPPSDSRTRPPTMSAPYNVERLNAIATDTQAVNDIWRKALRGTIWSNYQLVLVQWPRQDRIQHGATLFRDIHPADLPVHPAPPCSVIQPRANIANSVMETFLQSTDAIAGCSTSEASIRKTCMGCHYGAHNYDFIWAIPLNRASGDAAVDVRNRGSALSTLSKTTGSSSR